MSGRRSYGRRPKQRAATPAQIAASERAWGEAHGSFSGRAVKGEIVLDYTEQAFRVTRGGRRYHEDVDSLLYPVVACRTPAPLAATLRLREIIDGVLRSGTHEPGSRGLRVVEGKLEPGEPCPAYPGDTADRSDDLSWSDGRPGSLASFPELAVRGDYLRAVRPNYDDAPSLAWVHDRRLAREARKLIARSPQPTHAQKVHVQLRGAAAAAKAVGEGLRALSRASEEAQ